jgi:hypothetical protein
MELTLQVAQEVFGLTEGKHFHLAMSSPKTIDFRKMGLNHQLSFRSADNPKHFVSDSITHWRWSEPGVSKPEIHNQLMNRLRDTRGKVLQGLADGTPEGLNHWETLANLPGVGRDRISDDGKRRRFIVETSENKKYLPEGYIEGLRARYSHDPSRLLSYEKGLFVPFTKGSAYWAYNDHLNLIADDYRVTPDRPVLLSLDFNVSPMAWVVAQKYWEQKSVYHTRTEKYLFLEESSGETLGLLDALAEFMAKFPAAQYGNTEIQIYGDASGYARDLHRASEGYTVIEQTLRAKGYRRISIMAERSNPLVKDRLEKAAQVMSYERMAVHIRCTRLRQSFVKTALKEGTWDIEKPGRDDWTHYADAASYLLYEIYKMTNLTDPNSKQVYGL